MGTPRVIEVTRGTAHPAAPRVTAAQYALATETTAAKIIAGR